MNKRTKKLSANGSQDILNANDYSDSYLPHKEEVAPENDDESPFFDAPFEVDRSDLEMKAVKQSNKQNKPTKALQITYRQAVSCLLCIAGEKEIAIAGSSDKGKNVIVKAASLRSFPEGVTSADIFAFLNHANESNDPRNALVCDLLNSLQSSAQQGYKRVVADIERGQVEVEMEMD